MRTRWDMFLRELRKLVFGACCALGGLAGLWVAMWSIPEPEHRSNFKAADLGAALSRVSPTVPGDPGIGLAGGIGLGLLICLTALKPRSEAGDAAGRRS